MGQQMEGRGCSEDRVGLRAAAGRQTQAEGSLGNHQLPLRPSHCDFIISLRCIKSDSSGHCFVINIDKTGNFTHLISLKVFEDDVMTF